MAELFINQANHYAKTRPDYPAEMFEFIASKTPARDFVWDAGTGSGQAAQSLAKIYKNVVATDTSPEQLRLAPELPNVRYVHVTPTMSVTETERHVAPESSLDLVTVAQALHWFDLPSFYAQARWALKKPNGVVAAWCYTLPRVDPSVDAVLDRFYAVDSRAYWDPRRGLVEEEYRGVDFPFRGVDGVGETGPFRFLSEKVMEFGGLMVYLRSWSAYQTAKEKGVELLGDRVVEDFRRAWGSDCNKVVKFPVSLRIGKVGDSLM